MKDDDPDKHKWFHDYLSPGITMLYRVRKEIYKGQTRYQSVEIIDTDSFGVCLVLDGKVQSSSCDEFIYHEALVHPAMLAHPRPEKVMIAGGGEGATLREVLAHSTVRKAVMVDIDEEEVGICRRFLPSFHQNSFDDPRAELCFSDARKYLEESREKFDVIIIDLVDPLDVGPARLLYTQEFYRIVSQRLAPGGIMSVQAEPAGWLDSENFVAIVNTLKTVFSLVSPYHVHVPAFNTLWGFASASQSVDPAKLTPEEIDARISTRFPRELRSYDGSTHRAMFAIPKHIRGQLAGVTDVITDSRPISAY
ncbi:MAG: polyamine aminopropyltransferase [Dehalococcoidia bacterium]|nr:polyamine aminopropyltransferase [Dehalococcoidia bacterium]